MRASPELSGKRGLRVNKVPSSDGRQVTNVLTPRRMGKGMDSCQYRLRSAVEPSVVEQRRCLFSDLASGWKSKVRAMAPTIDGDVGLELSVFDLL